MSPFIFDQPVSESTGFVGRQLLLRTLMDGLCQQRSYAVLGGPQLGKSSLLLRLGHSLQERSKRRTRESLPIVVLVVPPSPFEPNSFWRELNRCICQSIPNFTPATQTSKKNSQRTTVVVTEKPWHAVQKNCQDMWRTLAGTHGWRRYILLLDQADILAETNQREHVLALFDWIQSHQDGAPDALVLTGSRQLREASRDPKGVFAHLRPLFLRLLTVVEARRLCQAAFKDADSLWQDNILRATGRHPFLLQRLLAAMSTRPTPCAIDDLWPETQPNIENWFEQIWNQLDFGRGVNVRGSYAAPEHALLQWLIQRAEPMSLRLAERELGIRPLNEFAELLEYLGIVETVLVKDEPRYQAPIGLWNNWYRQRIRLSAAKIK